MTDIIIHKHSITANDVPTASELDLGELAIQAADGHIYLKRSDGAVVRVTMLPGGDTQQVLYKTGSGDYALSWGTISSTLIGGALWSEVVAEVQRVFALVEGTASVLLSAPATLTAGSTGPITVSVADAAYLADGTSITGVLGTAYGTLSRSGTTYSFVSNQNYISDVTFATGTRFAAAYLNNTFNPLRIGSAQVEEDNSYAESGYAYVMLDADGRVACGVKADGSLVALKPIQADINANEIFVNKLTAPGGSIDLDSSDTRLQNIIDGGAHSGSRSYDWIYGYAFIDANDRIAYAVRNDGSVEFSKTIQGNAATADLATTAASAAELNNSEGAVEPDGTFATYSYAIVDSNNRISFGVTETGDVFLPSVERSIRYGAAHSSYGLYSVVIDQYGKSQIQVGADDKVSALTSAGSNWDPAITAESPERVLFQSDRTSGVRYWVMNNDGTRQAPATPDVNDITFWGDSMTQRLQGYAHLPGLLSGRAITYNALGGTSIENVIARQGGENATCTIPSGSIPASGSVALQNVWPSLGYHAGTLSNGDTYSYRVLIAGVEGTLTSTTNSSSQADYTFARTTAGSSVTVSGPVEIVVLANITQSSFGFSKSNTAVFWIGTNPLSRLPSTTYNPNSGSGIYYKSPATIYDPTNSTAVQSRTEEIVQAMLTRVENLDRHILITGPFIGQGQVWASSVEKQAIVAGFATFSKHWYDLRSDFIAGCKSWLQTNYSSVYTNWATTDDDHVTNGAAPPILREDGIHLNTYGTQLVSQLIAGRLSLKQW